MKIIIGILIFCFIIIFHEFGHFLMAKLNHITVNEFSIGFGPKLFHFKKGETEYCIKLIPFGGSCMMADGENETDNDDPHAFTNASVWSRIAVVLGGPIFNFILAFLLSIIMISLSGVDRPVVNQVTEDYPAAQAGLLPGDEIVQLNDFKTYFFRDVSSYIAMHNGESLQTVYRRDGKEYLTTITPIFNEDEGRYYIGITNTEGYTKASGLALVKYSCCEVRYWIYTTLQSIKMIIQGSVHAEDLSGPVGIVNVVGDTYDQAAKYGALVVFVNMINIAILLSANLGVMNLLPLPALDGGRFLILLVEAVLRKKLPEKVEAMVNATGMMLLFALMIFVMGNDIRKLFM